MKIRRLHIRNFRCLRDVEIPLDDVTVLIGENNAGKSALLDALRLALRGPRGGQRSPSVAEYDFHLADRDADPRTGGDIEIDVVLEETRSGEWPETLAQALTEIVQVDPLQDLSSVHLRFHCSYPPGAREPSSTWEFLNQAGETLRVGSPDRLRRLLDYVRLFQLAAVRDAGEHFSQRSSFWAPLLRSLVIPETERREIEEGLEALNRKLLEADPRLAEVTQTLAGMGDVVSEAGGHEVQVRALPLKPWDLMSRSQVVLRAGKDRAELPLERHGQGVQTLAVLFLFKAFVQHLLAADSKPGAEPLLTLEEPEAHLHPQSARALWREIKSLPGQVVVASHSPYFVQYVPFRKLRVLRRGPTGTRVFWLRESYSVTVSPNVTGLSNFCQASGGSFEYGPDSGRLTTRTRISERDFKRLRKASPQDAAGIRQLREDAASLVSDAELTPLESAARRVRGEILFARAWILCEGESDLLVLNAMAEMLGTPLDRSGISLIDIGTGVGTFGAFASLARALGYPWFVLCDGDAAGDGYLQELANQGFNPEEVSQRAVQLPRGQKLEGFLVANGFDEELSREFPASVPGSARGLLVAS